MGYTKNTWQTNDIVTATKLNNIEQGIENAIPNPHTGNVNDVLTKTENGVKWAPPSGGVESVNGKTGTVVLNSNDINDGDDTIHNVLGGKADLVSGKVPASQLPSYVDDVLEYNNLEAFPQTGETGKIYVAIDTNFTYRWSGSAYIKIGGGDEVIINEITLGENEITYELEVESSTYTPEEIYDFIQDGKIVIALVDRITVYNVSANTGKDSGYVVTMTAINYISSNSISFYQIEGFQDGDEIEWTMFDTGVDTLVVPTADSAEDYNKYLKLNNTGAFWSDIPAELPTGGTAGQVLTKTASGTEWADASGGDTEILIVTGTLNEPDDEGEGTLSNVSHTYAQIKVAYDNGKLIAFNDGENIYPLNFLWYSAESRPVENIAFFSSQNTYGYFRSIEICAETSENRWYENSFNYGQLVRIEKTLLPTEHYVANMSYSQIMTAYGNNDIIVAQIGDGNTERIVNLKSVENKYENKIVFESVDYTITIDEEDNVSVEETGRQYVPTYTSTDANKVLAVNAQGTGIGWNPAGGAEKFVVTFSQEDDTIIADKTPSEIIAAHAAGKIIEGIWDSMIFSLDDAEELIFGRDCENGRDEIYADNEEGWVISEFKFIKDDLNSGDIIYGSNTSMGPSKLSIGSSGQVLTVENGLPAWKTPSGGSGAEKFVVTFSEERWSSEDECYLVDSDKSIKEIYQAYSQGKIVEGIHDSGSYKYIYQLETCGHESGEYSIGFVTNYDYSGRKNIICFECNDENNKEFMYEEIDSLELPHHDIEDVGKVLTVNYNGEDVEWKTPEKELPTYTSTDANKVLAVNAQGTGIGWNPAGGGGAEKFVCYFTMDEDTEEITCDKTMEQIIQAQTSGKIIEATYNDRYYYISGLCDEEAIAFFCAEAENLLSYTEDGIEEERVRFVPAGHSGGIIYYPNNQGKPTELIAGSNGQVLTVENGLPAWKTPSGGDNDYIVEFELTATSPEDWTFVSSSKTPAEIIAAFNAHKNVRGIANVSDFLNLELKLVYVSEESIGFGCLGDSYTGYEVGAMKDDDVWEWRVTVTALEELPSYDNDDENKVLTLAYAGGDDVTVQWSNIPKELPATLGTAGQVLTVNSSATGVEWGTAASESDLFLVKTVYAGSSQYRADKTASEIYEAVQAGKKVVMQEQYSDTDSEYAFFELVKADKDNSDNYYIRFSNLKNVKTNDVSKIRYEFRFIEKQAGSTVLYSKEYTSAPNYPSLAGEAGKVLKVREDEEGFEWAEAGGGSGGDSSITDDQMVQLLIQADMLPVVYQVSGNQEQIFTDETGKVLLW